MPNKYITIHGHFYQPPRENPWLEEILEQPTAAPFANWNERINYECYAPNRAARILNKQGRIVKIVNNFDLISFNIGPTLMSWIEKFDKYTYQKILEADRMSISRFGGHGNAIAQAYNHMILPLANQRDKETQIRWGIYDFEYRFERKPEGMWMPETAADIATLEAMAAHKIKFTICAPRQAKAIKKEGSNEWNSIDEGNLDTSKPYKVILPSGRTISIFFYNGQLSQAVAFERILDDGHVLAERLADSELPDDSPGLIHIATDGESYGHHHRYGEMALAACLDALEKNENVLLTNYGQFLELFPPRDLVQLHEVSSWSCYHGVGRWERDCGCSTGSHQGWNQKFREPLRQTFNWLRNSLDEIFEKEGDRLFHDAWFARNDYISVVMDRNPDYVASFLKEHMPEKFAGEKAEQVKALRLLEMQRQTMLTFTSCGWFFDDISGVEGVQVLLYACRALMLAEYLGYNLHQTFEEKLALIPSNDHSIGNGLNLYKKQVITEEIRLERVALHIAVAALFENIEPDRKLYNIHINSILKHREYLGNKIFAIGHSKIRSIVTWAEMEFCFGAVYQGDNIIRGYVWIGKADKDFSKFIKKSQAIFLDGKFDDLDEYLKTNLGSNSIHFDDLLKNEKLKVLRFLSKKNMKSLVPEILHIYKNNIPILKAMDSNGYPIAGGFLAVVSFSLNAELIEELTAENINYERLAGIQTEFNMWHAQIEDPKYIGLLVERALFKKLRVFEHDNRSIDSLESVIRLLDWVENASVPLNMWKSQNELTDLIRKNSFSDEAYGYIQKIKSKLLFETVE